MRVIISGPVTPEHLETAELIAGIEPTSFVTNGQWTPPASDLPTEVFPLCTKIGDLAEHQRNYTLCNYGDALIVVGGNDHLVRIARLYGMPVFEEA